MSRKPIIAGNWKMNLNHQEALAFAQGVKDNIPAQDKLDTVIGAPSLFLYPMQAVLEDSDVQLAAQNCYFEDEGAYTGETSPKALGHLGIDYVILGHSERREYFHETDQDVNKKAHAVLENGMVPIICVGETLDQNEAGETDSVITSQVQAALEGLSPDQVQKVVIAYEPVWAIGTGKSSSADQANVTCATIRQVIAGLTSEELAQEVRIQYGGSVKPDNIKSFLSQDHIDGALVGGASLELDSFLALLEAIE